MSIWNYIGEFFLFRWLFDKFRKSTTEHYEHTEDLGASIADSNNSENIDDLDRFMHNNGNNHYSKYGNDYSYSNHNDWNTKSYNDSYDDFLDEQDDYDMMDDDF